MAVEQKVAVALVAGGRAPDTLTYTVPADLPEAARPLHLRYWAGIGS